MTATTMGSNLFLAVVVSSFFALLCCIVFVSPVHGSPEISGSKPNAVGISYTREEQDALGQFRNLMGDHLYKDHMKTDEYLIRWLRARKMNVGEAAQMLAKSLEWRRINKIDTIHEEDFSVFKKMFPFTVDGIDRAGRPVGICLTGKQDVRKALIAGEREHFLRYYAYQIEMLDRLIRKSSNESEHKNITTCTLILDLNGFNLRQHVCVACLPVYFDFLSIYENHYPQILHALYVLNAPGIFEPIRPLLRPFLSGSTRSVLKLYGYNRDEWKEQLFKDIAPDQLPTSLGGTRQTL